MKIGTKIRWLSDAIEQMSIYVYIYIYIQICICSCTHTSKTTKVGIFWYAPACRMLINPTIRGASVSWVWLIIMNDGNVCVLVVLLTEPLIKKSSEVYQVSEGGDIFFCMSRITGPGTASGTWRFSDTGLVLNRWMQLFFWASATQTF